MTAIRHLEGVGTRRVRTSRLETFVLESGPEDGVPVLLVGLGATPWTVDLAELRLSLLRPDDGSVALIIIGATAWIAWAVMAFCLLTEIVAADEAPESPIVTPPSLGMPMRSIDSI